MVSTGLIARIRLRAIVLLTLLLVSVPGIAFAAEDAISHADNAFIMITSAMVMLMVIGLALFYGGMVPKNSVLNTMMMSFVTLCVVSLVWVLWGYSLAFGTTINGFVGSLEYLGFSGVGMEPSDGLAHCTFAIFQMMFACLTVALISGAYVSRMRFSAFLIFGILWATIVYAPLCHWVWGGGWLGELGVLDFAGGKVVHISSGIAALVGCLVLGARKGYGQRPMPPHNLPMTLLGAGLLWFGWFGFNAGSALAADGVAANAFMVTQIATALGVLGWVVAEWIRHGKPTLLGAASGAIAGLVSITPAAGFVGPLAAIVIGFGSGIICFIAVAIIKQKLGYDDSLDVFGIHGVGGTWGALITGVFAAEAIGGTAGLLEGNAAQLGVQAIAVVSTIVFVAIATFIILKIVNIVVPIRVSENDEDIGVDLALHGEDAYSDQVTSSGTLQK